MVAGPHESDAVSSILIADIGGTNARFAIADGDAIRSETWLKVADFPGPVEAARHYLTSCGQHPARAAFAVAGPVTGADAFELTNHPWRFSIEATRRALGLAWLELINDFHAVALGNLLWIAARLLLITTVFTIVIVLFGAAESPLVVFAIPVAVLTGLAFASPIAA